MSYPQPSSNNSVINGAEFFRLFTPLTSPGDIYESEVSGHAMALGPDSDVANVTVAYWDNQVQTFVNLAQLGPPRSFVGRVDARNTDNYAPSNRPGRILLFPSDLFDPTFLPEDFLPNQDTLTFITPVLDVIQYFKPQESLTPARNDKTFRFPEIELTDIRTAFLILPFWGRKYASARIFNNSNQALAWRITGIDYFPNDQNKAIETDIDHIDLLNPGLQHTSIVNASVHGMFDALMLEVNVNESQGSTPFEVVVSDIPA